MMVEVTAKSKGNNISFVFRGNLYEIYDKKFKKDMDNFIDL